MLHALFQINFEAIPAIIIIHILLNINIYAADSIHKAHKAFKIHHHVIINLDAQELLRGLLRQLAPAVGIGMINLIPAMPLNTHACITRHGKQGSSLFIRIEHYHKKRIAASHIVFLGTFIHT